MKSRRAGDPPNSARASGAFVRLGVYLPAVAAILAAVALAFASALTFERVQSAVDAWSPKGHAEGFTPALFQSVRQKLRIGALVLMAVAPLLVFFRRALAGAVLACERDLRGWTAGAWRRAIAVCRQETGMHLAIFAFLGVAGVVLRAVSITQPVNYDEAFTFITYVRRPLWVSLADYSYPNNHLFHTMLAHVSTQALGLATWTLRLPAFTAGCLVIPLSYIVARRICDKTTGLTAAALVSTADVLIAFSVLARGYTLITAFFLLMMICADDIASGDRRAWTPFVIVAAFGFYTVPTFVYPYLVVATYLMLTTVQRQGATAGMARQIAQHTMATAAIVVLGYLPAMTVSGLSSGASYGYRTDASAFAGVPALGRFLSAFWVDAARGTNPWLIGALIIGAIVSLLAPRRSAIILALAVVFWMVSATLIQRVVMPPRVWLFAVPVMLMISAAGIGFAASWIAHRLKCGTATADAIVTVAVIAPLCVYAWMSRPPQRTEVFGQDEIAMTQDVGQVVTYLKGALQPGDAVVSVFPTVDLIEYYFWLQRMPTALLKTRPASATRYLVVTNDAIGQGLGAVLAKAGVSTTQPKSVQPMRRFGYDAVYDVRLK